MISTWLVYSYNNHRPYTNNITNHVLIIFLNHIILCKVYPQPAAFAFAFGESEYHWAIDSPPSQQSPQKPASCSGQVPGCSMQRINKSWHFISTSAYLWNIHKIYIYIHAILNTEKMCETTCLHFEHWRLPLSLEASCGHQRICCTPGVKTNREFEG